MKADAVSAPANGGIEEGPGPPVNAGSRSQIGL